MLLQKAAFLRHLIVMISLGHNPDIVGKYSDVVIVCK